MQSSLAFGPICYWGFLLSSCICQDSALQMADTQFRLVEAHRKKIHFHTWFESPRVLVSGLVGSLCSNNVISFTVSCFYSPLCWSLSQGIFTHRSKKVSSLSELLFLSTQQPHWEESFCFPIILEKVLELVSTELASSCAHLWPRHCGLEDIWTVLTLV